MFTPSTTPGTATYTVTSEPVGITGSGTSPIRLNVSHLSNSYTIYVTATINGVTSKAASITTSNYSWPNPNFLNLFPKSERTINLVINPNVLNEFLRFTSEWTNMKSACSGTTCNSGVSFLNVDCSFFRLSIYNNTDDTDNNLIHYGEHSNSNNFKFPSNSTKIIIKIFLDHNRGLTTLNSAYVNTNGDVQFLYSSGNPSSGVTILGFFFQTYISLIFDTVNKSVTSYIETRFDINFSLFGWFRTMLYDGILKNTSTGFPFFGGRVNMNNPPYPAHMTDYNKTLNNYITISST